MKFHGRRQQPPPTEAEIDRADRWLREAFQQELQRVSQREPADLHDRCLKAVRAETESRSPRWTWQPEFAWAGLVVLALVAAGLLIWQFETTETASPAMSGLENRDSAPAAKLVRPDPTRVASPENGESAAMPQQVARDSSPPTILRPAHTNAGVDRNHAVVQRRTSHRANDDSSLASNHEESNDVVTYTTDDGDVVSEWKLAPANPRETASGVAQLVTSTATTEPVQTFTVEVANFAPDKPYQMLVQVNDASDAVLIGEGRSDSSGKIVLTAAITPEISQAIYKAGTSIRSQSGSTSFAINYGQSSGRTPITGSGTLSHPLSSESSVGTDNVLSNVVGPVLGSISSDAFVWIIIRTTTGDVIFHSAVSSPGMPHSMGQ